MAGYDFTMPESLPQVNVVENGDEQSMSVDDTNKMRIALGLPPLNTGPSKTKKEIHDADAIRAAKEQEEETKALREKLAAKKAARKMNEDLAKVKTLGEADDTGDDMLAWIQKSRRMEGVQKRKERAQEAKQAVKGEDEEMKDAEEEEAPAGAPAGMKVKHDMEELQPGQTAILTFEDRGILDDAGNIIDGEAALQESALVEQTERTAAFRKGAKVANPLFQEDGKKRAILDKYDDDDGDGAAGGFVLDAGGTAEDATVKKQEEIKAKLQEASAMLMGDGPKLAADFYTKEEMAAKFPTKLRKRKKKKRAKRTTAAAVVDDEDGGGGGIADVMAALEAEAGEIPGGQADMGSRKSRKARAEAKAAEADAEKARKTAKFEAAVARGNLASEALRYEEPVGADEDEADAALEASLARSRAAAEAAAPARKVTALAEDLAKKREEDEKELAAKLAEQREKGGMAAGGTRPAAEGEKQALTEFDSAAQFVAAAPEDDKATAPPPPPPPAAEEAEEAEEDAMDEDADEAGPSTKEESTREEGGQWVSANEPEEPKIKAPSRKRNYRKRDDGKPAAQDTFTSDVSLGKGLAGALEMLKGSGALTERIHWAGRTNDKKPGRLADLKEVHKRDGSWRDGWERSVDVALTRKDEFGRQMTPKEAFRAFCHDFHGIYPSKSKEEKRIKQYREEIKLQKAGSALGTTEGGALATVRKLQSARGSAHVVLDGGGRDTPMGLMGAGTDTPLMGDAKVEAMLGIKKESMGPPPPKKPKQ